LARLDDLQCLYHSVVKLALRAALGLNSQCFRLKTVLFYDSLMMNLVRNV